MWLSPAFRFLFSVVVFFIALFSTSEYVSYLFSLFLLLRRCCIWVRTVSYQPPPCVVEFLVPKIVLNIIRIYLIKIYNFLSYNLPIWLVDLHWICCRAHNRVVYHTMNVVTPGLTSRVQFPWLAMMDVCMHGPGSKHSHQDSSIVTR